MVETLNWVVLALSLICCVIAWEIYQITRAVGVLILMFAFIWSSVVRAGISFQVPFLDDYSRPLTAITFVFHTAGMLALLIALRSYYRKNGGDNE
jgi:hypothetical protein